MDGLVDRLVEVGAGWLCVCSSVQCACWSLCEHCCAVGLLVTHRPLAWVSGSAQTSSYRTSRYLRYGVACVGMQA